MTGYLTKTEIEQQLRDAASEFSDYCLFLPDEIFFYQPADKWSAAQQTKHLISATNAAKLAFVLPKFMVRWVAGKPNRQSRTFDELVAKYKMKLAQGGKASSPFVPKPIPASYGKEKLVKNFNSSMNKMANAVNKNWKESQTDQYIAPHPLLGKITLTELCYFTIHHTKHHLESIKNLTAKLNSTSLDG